MKVKKILLVIMSVMFILGVMAVPASAAEPGGEVAEPYAVICDDCGGRTTTTYTTWSTYVADTDEEGNDILVTCRHGYKYGQDKRKVSMRIKTVQCQSCPFEYAVIEKRYSYECHGFN